MPDFSINVALILPFAIAKDMCVDLLTIIFTRLHKTQVLQTWLPLL
jgi:hypothetical protein